MKKVLAFFLVICCASVYAQEMTEGFIIKTSKDTLRGFIRERFEWARIQSVEFATSATDEPSKIAIEEVDNFYLKKYDTYFYRRTLDIDKKPVDITRLETTPERHIERETIVIQLQVKGAVNLYDYLDENGKKHFFVQKGNDKIEELAYARYLAVSGSRVVEQPFFLEPLRLMLSDCGKVKNVSPRYDERSFRKLITQYNSCFSTEQHEAKKAKGHFAFGIFVGGGPATIDYDGNDITGSFSGVEPSTAEFSSTSVVVAGINMEFHSGRSSRFIPGLQVSYVKSGSVTAERVYITSRRDMWMDYSVAPMVIGLKYVALEKERLKFYLKGTAGVQLLLTSTSKYTGEDFIFNSKTEPQDFAKYKKNGYAYSVGVGTSYDRFSFEINYQKNAILGTNSSQGLISSFSAMVGFSLTRP